MSALSISGKFRDDVDLAGHLAVRARVFLDIWWVYEGEPTRKKYLATMNRFSEFYRFDPHAHFVAMVMYLSQLFEPRGDTLNFPSLLKSAPSAEVATSVTEHGLSILDAANPLVSKVMILRSNLFAHRSAKLSYAEVFELAKVTADELRELSDAALRIANVLGEAAGACEKIVHVLSPAHTEGVLKALASSDADA
jgi:hypothetical protein